MLCHQPLPSIQSLLKCCLQVTLPLRFSHIQAAFYFIHCVSQLIKIGQGSLCSPLLLPNYFWPFSFTNLHLFEGRALRLGHLLPSLICHLCIFCTTHSIFLSTRTSTIIPNGMDTHLENSFWPFSSLTFQTQ